MSFALGFLLLIVGLIVIVWVANIYSEVAGPLIVGYVLRTTAALFDVFVLALPGADDGYGWHRLATYWARGGVEGAWGHFGFGHYLYVWLMSLLYAVFTPSRLMIQAINVIFGTLVIFAVWRIAELVGNDRSRARRAAWFAAVFPSLVYFSAVLLREVAVAFPLTMSIVYLLRWHKERSSKQLILALAMLLLSMAFHSGGVAVLVFAGLWLVSIWIRALFTLRSRDLAKSTIALVVGLSVVGGVLGSGFGMQKFHGLETGSLSTLTERQDGFATGRAAYLEDLHADTPLEVVVQAPLRLTYFLFAPFPWMLHSAADAFGVVDSTLILYLFYRMIRQRKAIQANPAARLVIGVFRAMAVVFALGVSNYGTALRHRSKMMPLLIAASVAIPAERKRKRERERFVPLPLSRRSA